MGNWFSNVVLNEPLDSGIIDIDPITSVMRDSRTDHTDLKFDFHGYLQKVVTVKASLKISKERKVISVANVVSMEFKTEDALQDFAARYDKVAPIHYPQAEVFLFIKTDDQSDLRKSIYASKGARVAGNQKRNKHIETTEMAPLFKEAFRVKGDVMVKHIMPEPKDM